MSKCPAPLVLLVVLGAVGCRTPGPRPIPGTELIVEGRRLFFEETFAGNGRTCGTCHPAGNNFTIDPTQIAALPTDDPLFVADTSSALGRRFENNDLMHRATGRYARLPPAP